MTQSENQLNSKTKLAEAIGFLDTFSSKSPVNAEEPTKVNESDDNLAVRRLQDAIDNLSGYVDTPNLTQLEEPTSQKTKQEVSAALSKITEKDVVKEVKRILGSTRDVPWQTGILTISGTVAKAALTMLVKREAKHLTAEVISIALEASYAIPIASGFVAAGADAVRMYNGGLTSVYDSAAQHTASGLFRVKGKGDESQKEHEKNRIERKRQIPLRLFRKIGVFFNMFRSATTQVSIGVTKARSEVSKELEALGVSEQVSHNELVEKIIEAANYGWLTDEDILELGKTLARLRSLGNYGDIDVYGAKGSGIYKVNEAHTPELMRDLYETLNELVLRNDIGPTDEEESAKFKKKWKKEYLDLKRSRKDFGAKTLTLVGSLFSTFAMTFLFSYASRKVPGLISGLINRWKEARRHEFEHLANQALVDSYNHAKETVNTSVQNGQIPFGEQADVSLPTFEQLLPSLKNGQLPDQSILDHFDKYDYGGGLVAYDIDHDNSYDFIVFPDGSISKFDPSTSYLEPLFTPNSQAVDVSNNHAGSTPYDMSQDNQIIDAVKGNSTPGISDVSQHGLNMDHVNDHAGNLDLSSQNAISPVVDQPMINNTPNVEISANSFEHGPSDVPTPSVDNMGSVADATIENTRKLGESGIAWNAIWSSITNNKAIEVDNPTGTTNVIENFCHALNPKVNMNSLSMNATFAIRHGLSDVLPQGVTGWFLSENQIENLAPVIDEAISASKNNEALTEVQEILVRLNSSSGEVAKAMDELNRDPELLKEILDIANGQGI